MLHAIWNYLFGWAGLDIILGGICVAVAALEPPIIAALVPDLRKWAIACAVVAFTFAGIEAHGYKLGYDEAKRQWDAALAREAVNGEKARADAERTVDADASDRSVYDNDKWNRDGGKSQLKPRGPVRWLESYHLLRSKGHDGDHPADTNSQPDRR